MRHESRNPARQRDDYVSLRVLHGRVSCPLRGNCDVEQCFYCPRLLTLDMDARPPYLTCRPDASVTVDLKRAYERLGVLELAEALGNVTQACKERGISRSQFYKYKHRYEQEGLNGLRGASRRRLEHHV